MKVTVRANAKLNLSLDVVGKRDDDYHLLESVMQSVSLCDVVNVRDDDGEGEIRVFTSDDSIADDNSNIAYRAAEKFFEETGVDNPGITIKIKKNIPVGAGMAGGSADAAAVIFALNEIMRTDLSETQLCDIGEQVGADVPFCLTGGTMLARGTGNILYPLPDLPQCSIVIAKPETGVSTASAYKAIDERTEPSCHPDFEEMGEEICEGNLSAVAKRLYNVFETVIDLPEVSEIKKRMINAGALGACMTGSGSAVFGIFLDDGDAAECASQLRKDYDEVFITEPVSKGCMIDD